MIIDATYPINYVRIDTLSLVTLLELELRVTNINVHLYNYGVPVLSNLFKLALLERVTIMDNHFHLT